MLRVGGMREKNCGSWGAGATEELTCLSDFSKRMLGHLGTLDRNTSMDIIQTDF